jgi:hypothetical protein
MALSRTEQRRITFLSLLGSAATAGSEDPFSQAEAWLANMVEDGFFDEPAEARASRPTQQRSERSARPASRGQSSKSGSRGRDQGSQPFSGQYRNPDGPPTDAQVGAVLRMSDDYTEDELWDMTKQEVGNLISDLTKG